MKEKVKILLPAFLGLILSGLLLYGLIFPGPRTKLQQIITQPEKILPQKSPKAEVKLEISPAEATIAIGEILEIRVLSESAEQLIAADLDLSFDPQVLTLTEIKPGSFWLKPQELTKVIDHAKGEIIYGIATLEPKSGRGIIASLKFKVQKKSTASITTLIKFQKESQASVKNHEVNLNLASVGKYTVLNTQ